MRITSVTIWDCLILDSYFPHYCETVLQLPFWSILGVKRWYVPHVHTQPCRFGLQSLSTVTNIPQTWSDLLTGLYDVLFQTNPCFWKYDGLALDQINRFKPETDKEWLCQIRNSPWKPIGGVPCDRFFGVYTIQYNQYTFLYTRVPISYQSEIQPESTPPVSAFCLFSERCAFSFACFHFFQTPWLSRASSTVTKPDRVKMVIIVLVDTNMFLIYIYI